MWVSLEFQAPTVMLCSALQREALRFEAFDLHTLLLRAKGSAGTFREGALLTGTGGTLGPTPTAQPNTNTTGKPNLTRRTY